MKYDDERTVGYPDAKVVEFRASGRVRDRVAPRNAVMARSDPRLLRSVRLFPTRVRL
jgi:hypothetical protein